MRTTDEIKDFLSSLFHSKGGTLKGSFDVKELVELLAQFGWHQVDESSMKLRVRSPHDELSIPSSYFMYKGKQRKKVEIAEVPKHFIALDHNITEIWYANERSTLMYFEDYMHYHLMTFVQKPTHLPLL